MIGNDRIVITGLGLVTPIGCGVKHVWNNLLSGCSGIEKFRESDLFPLLKAKVYAYVPEGGNSSYQDFLASDYGIDARTMRRNDKFIIFAMAAAKEAMRDAGIADFDASLLNGLTESDIDFDKFGVALGSGIGGLYGIEQSALDIHDRLQRLQKDPDCGVSRKFTPFMIPMSLSNMAAGNVSIHYGLRGPNHSAVTACSTGGHSISDAARMMICDEADIMLSGSSEYLVGTLMSTVGFDSAMALSSNFNDEPTRASRPWDKDRDGFVIGSGAGVMILEKLSVARKRKANIYAEIVGYGLSADAYNITAPPKDGSGAARAMKSALAMAKVKAEDVGYINAHGTSTPVGDVAEIAAIRSVFGDHVTSGNVAISSTKSAIGHLLGAAGSVEAVFTALALKEGKIPPTLNLDNPIQEVDGMNLVPHVYQEKDIRYAMSNSFGFGGTNISLLMKSFNE